MRPTPAVSEFSSPPRTLLEQVDQLIERYPFRPVKPRRTEVRRVFPPPLLHCGEGGLQDGTSAGRPVFPENRITPVTEEKDSRFWQEVAEFLRTENGQRVMAGVVTAALIALVGLFLFGTGQ